MEHILSAGMNLDDFDNIDINFVWTRENCRCQEKSVAFQISCEKVVKWSDQGKIK